MTGINPYNEKPRTPVDVNRQSKAIREEDERARAGKNDPAYVHRMMVQEELAVVREALESDDLYPAEREDYEHWYYQITGEVFEKPEEDDETA